MGNIAYSGYKLLFTSKAKAVTMQTFNEGVARGAPLLSNNTAGNEGFVTPFSALTTATDKLRFVGIAMDNADPFSPVRVLRSGFFIPLSPVDGYELVHDGTNIPYGSWISFQSLSGNTANAQMALTDEGIEDSPKHRVGRMFKFHKLHQVANMSQYMDYTVVYLTGSVG